MQLYVVLFFQLYFQFHFPVSETIIFTKEILCLIVCVCVIGRGLCKHGGRMGNDPRKNPEWLWINGRTQGLLRVVPLVVYSTKHVTVKSVVTF